MVKRTVTGVIMAGFLFLVIWLSGLNEYTYFIFDALVLVFGAIASYEIYGAVKRADIVRKGAEELTVEELTEKDRGYRINGISLILMVVATYVLSYFFGYIGIFFAFIISFVFAFCWFIFDEKKTFADFAVNVFALVYPMGMLGAVFVMFHEFGMIPVLLALGISTISDALAYWVGILFGKKKIFPKISPKKTYAGCIGGLFGGALGGAIIYLIFELGGFPTYTKFTFSLISDYPYLWYMLIGFVLAFFSEIGDLAASRVKRAVGIKDYGKLLGSHGGVLDRIDSILFTVVCMAIIMALIKAIAS